MYKTGFEILNETDKVRCQVCLASSGYEPWINRTSAWSHLKSERHRGCEEAKKRHKETEARLSQNSHRDAEWSATMWDAFLTPEVIPSIQVNARERVVPAHPVLVEEECEQPEWLVSQFINHTEDTTGSEANGRDRSLDDWIAATFGEDVLLGPDEEDETVTNVLNTACLFFPQPRHVDVSYPPLDSKMSLDKFESVAFGKPFPDRKAEWYPYESKTVRCVMGTISCASVNDIFV